MPLILGVGAALSGGAVTAGVTYYFTPKYTNDGYQPVQPVPFSHKVHAGELGIDCRYCHNGVEKSWFSNLPGASTCMNCHSTVLKDDPRLAIVRESASTGKPITWIQIHHLPEYAYFNHSVHVARGISCVECHGRVDQMDEVRQDKPLSMSFCLDCHRNPAAQIRPPSKVTDLGWKWSSDPEKNEEMQLKFGTNAVHAWNVRTRESCSTCHR